MRPPSMRFRVKPHSGILCFFLAPRGPSTLTIGQLAAASLLPLSWHSFSPAALPSPCRGGERRGRKNALSWRTLPHPDRCLRRPCCRLASSTDRAGRPDNRLSVWRSSRTPAPFTLYAQSVLDAKSRVHPSNERCPCGSPGGITATLSDSLLPQRSRPSFDPRCSLVHVAPTNHTAAAACFA
jgi:hypothetical protein